MKANNTCSRTPFASVFTLPQWWMKPYDGRRKEFRGTTRHAFKEARNKHFNRIFLHSITRSIHAQRVEYLTFFAKIPFTYKGDGLDDYNMYQRPSKGGVGYVAICPGEPRNNVYVDDPILVSILKNKYNRIIDR